MTENQTTEVITGEIVAAPTPSVTGRPGPDRVTYLTEKAVAFELTEDEAREWQRMSREERLAAYKPSIHADGTAIDSIELLRTDKLHLSADHAWKLVTSAIPPQYAAGVFGTIWTDEQLDSVVHRYHSVGSRSQLLVCDREKTKCRDGHLAVWNGSGKRHIPHRDGIFPALLVVRQNEPISDESWLNLPDRGVSGFQLRAADPAAWAKAGTKKPPKYKSPLGQNTDGDIPDAARDILLSEKEGTKTRLWITEGKLKAVAATLALGEPVLSIAGVTTHHEHGYASSVIPLVKDLDLVGRELILAFDSDLIYKAAVRAGLDTLAGALIALGARVRYAVIPDDILPDGKVGLDDAIDAGTTGDVVRSWITDELPPVVQQTITTAAGDSLNLPAPVKSHRWLAVSGEPKPWPEVVEEGEGWSIIDVIPSQGSALIARLGEHCGIWEVSISRGDEDGDGGAEYRQITSWVAWRTASVRTYTGNNESDDPMFTVALRLANGRTYSVNLDAKASLSPAVIQEATSAPIRLPDKTADLGAIRTALSMLGADEREEQRVWASMGWAKVDGKWAYLGPNGSVTYDGIRTDLAVETGDDSTESRTGWDRIPTTPEEHRAGIEALVGLIKASGTGHDEIGATIVGLICQSIIPMSQHVTVILQAERGAGKSVFAGLAYSFMNSRCHKSELPVDLTKSSAVGVRNSMTFHQHATSFFDDYRRDAESEAQRRNASASSVIGTILQSAYGAGGEKKGDRSGRERRSTRINSSALVTAEILPRSAAIVERAVTLIIQKGDLDLSENGSINEYRDRYAMTGLARMGMAGLIHYVVKNIEDWYDGDLRRFVAHWEDERADLMYDWQSRGYPDRVGENIATIYAGWVLLCAYASTLEANSADLIPDDIYELLTPAARMTLGQHQAVDPGTQLVAAIGELVASGRGHLACHGGVRDGLPAEGYETATGWERRAGYNGSTEWSPKGPRLGYISPDASHVLITADAIKTDAARAARLEGMDHKQMLDSVSKKTVDPTKAGGKQSLSYGIGMKGRQPRGYLVPATAIGLGDDDSGADDND